jgi:hypothetical protein
MTDGYLLNSVIYYVRGWKDKSLLDDIDTAKRENTLRELRESYTANNMSKFYIEDILLDFDSAHNALPAQKSSVPLID